MTHNHNPGLKRLSNLEVTQNASFNSSSKERIQDYSINSLPKVAETRIAQTILNFVSRTNIPLSRTKQSLFRLSSD